MIGIFLGFVVQKKIETQKRKWELEDKRREKIENDIKEFEEYLDNYYNSFDKYFAAIIHISNPWLDLDENYEEDLTKQIKGLGDDLSTIESNLEIKAFPLSLRYVDLGKDIEKIRELLRKQHKLNTDVVLTNINYETDKNRDKLFVEEDKLTHVMVSLTKERDKIFFGIHRKLEEIKDSLYKV